MTLSWDLFVILFFVIMAVYGFLLGRSRVFNILLSTYAGFAIADGVGEFVYDYLQGITQISHSVTISLFGAKIFVFALVVFVLTLHSELVGIKEDLSSSKVWTVIYGILAAGLILSSVIALMSVGERVAFLDVSPLAGSVYRLQVAWLIAPILTIVIANIAGRFSKK